MRGFLFNDGWKCCPCGSDLRPLKEAVEVSLPHDAMIGSCRDKTLDGGNRKGFFPDGTYMYKKVFEAKREWKDKHIYMLFEGVYRKSRIYVNEEYVGGASNGYTDIFFDITHALRYDRSNEIKVIVSTGHDSRWYSGAGIYRDVRLFVVNETHFAYEGIRLTTEAVRNGVASIRAEVHIENNSPCGKELQVDIQIFDREKKPVNRDLYRFNCKGTEMEVLYPRLYIKNAHIWDCDSPYLYTYAAKLLDGDEVIDEAEIIFGIRELSLDHINGLCVNGKSVKLYGGCIHHDNGVIGAVSFRRSEERKIRRLKAAGYNAIRSSHNPIGRYLLDACDKYGMLVMDELTDVWNTSKCVDDDAVTFSDEWEILIENMVQKDYNHPSVIMYSIGNEIPELGTRAGAKTARELANKIRELDPSRYVTCAINGLMSNIHRIDELFKDISGSQEDIGELQNSKDVNALMSAMGNVMKERQNHPEIVKSTAEAAESLDIVGYNYAQGRYLPDSVLFTNRVVVGTETFPKDLWENWDLTMKNGNVLGDFSWTAWDYIGEVGIGMNHFDVSLNADGYGAKYPYTTANCGDFDLIGERRPQSYYREIVVGHRMEPYIAVRHPKHYGEQPYVSPWSWFPTESTWTFHGYEGRKTSVEVYSDADEIALFLNGVCIGKKEVPKNSVGNVLAYYVTFEVVYEPGELTAVAYKNAEYYSEYKLRTAERAVTLCAEVEPEAEQDAYGLACGDISYISVCVKDQNGIVNTCSDEPVTVEIEGTGSLCGFGTGNPVTEQSYISDQCRLYHGKALLVVRADKPGTIRINISTEGKEKRHITLKSRES